MFRKYNDARVRVPKGTTEVKKHLPPEDFTYGKPSSNFSVMKGGIFAAPEEKEDTKAVIFGVYGAQ